jgi:hypothetical protein
MDKKKEPEKPKPPPKTTKARDRCPMEEARS